MWRVVLVACIAWSTRATADSGAPADAKLAGTVAVWGDAKWLTEPGGPSTTLSSSSKRTDASAVFTARVISTTEKYVEVEPLVERDCGSYSLHSDQLSRLRLFVSRADLAPVVIKPYTITHKNGSSVSLAVGMPVVKTERGTYAVVVDEVELEVDIPDTSIGYSYKPIKRPPRPSRYLNGKQFWAKPNTTATLGVRDVALDGSHYVRSVNARKADVVFPLVDACGKAGVVIAKTALESGKKTWRKPTMVDESCQTGCYDDRHWTIPKGTTLISPAGHAVAVAATDIPVALSTSADDKIQVCLNIKLELENGSTSLELCAPTKQVVSND